MVVRRALPHHRFPALRTALIQTPYARSVWFPRATAQANAVSVRAPEFVMTTHATSPQVCRRTGGPDDPAVFGEHLGGHDALGEQAVCHLAHDRPRGGNTFGQQRLQDTHGPGSTRSTRRGRVFATVTMASESRERDPGRLHPSTRPTRPAPGPPPTFPRRPRTGAGWG